MKWRVKGLGQHNNHTLLAVAFEGNSLETDDLFGVRVCNYDEPAGFFLLGEVTYWNVLSSSRVNPSKLHHKLSLSSFFDLLIFKRLVLVVDCNY